MKVIRFQKTNFLNYVLLLATFLFSITNENLLAMSESSSLAQSSENSNELVLLKNKKINRASFIGIKDPSDNKSLQFNIDLADNLIRAALINFNSGKKHGRKTIDRISDLVVHTLSKLEEYNGGAELFVENEIRSIQENLVALKEISTNIVELGGSAEFSAERIKNPTTNACKLYKFISNATKLAHAMFTVSEESSFGSDGGGVDFELFNVNQQEVVDREAVNVSSENSNDFVEEIQNLARRALNSSDQPEEPYQNEEGVQNLDNSNTANKNQEDQDYLIGEIQHLAGRALSDYEEIEDTDGKDVDSEGNTGVLAENNPSSNSEQNSQDAVDNVDSEDNTEVQAASDNLLAEIKSDLQEFYSALENGAELDLQEINVHFQGKLEEIINIFANDPSTQIKEIEDFNNSIDSALDHFAQKLESDSDFLDTMNTAKNYTLNLLNQEKINIIERNLASLLLYVLDQENCEEDDFWNQLSLLDKRIKEVIDGIKGQNSAGSDLMSNLYKILSDSLLKFNELFSGEDNFVTAAIRSLLLDNMDIIDELGQELSQGTIEESQNIIQPSENVSDVSQENNSRLERLFQLKELLAAVDREMSLLGENRQELLDIIRRGNFNTENNVLISDAAHEFIEAGDHIFNLIETSKATFKKAFNERLISEQNLDQSVRDLDNVHTTVAEQTLDLINKTFQKEDPITMRQFVKGMTKEVKHQTFTAINRPVEYRKPNNGFWKRAKKTAVPLMLLGGVGFGAYEVLKNLNALNNQNFTAQDATNFQQCEDGQNLENCRQNLGRCEGNLSKQKHFNEIQGQVCSDIEGQNRVLKFTNESLNGQLNRSDGQLNQCRNELAQAQNNLTEQENFYGIQGMNSSAAIAQNRKLISENKQLRNQFDQCSNNLKEQENFYEMQGQICSGVNTQNRQLNIENGYLGNENEQYKNQVGQLSENTVSCDKLGGFSKGLCNYWKNLQQGSCDESRGASKWFCEKYQQNFLEK